MTQLKEDISKNIPNGTSSSQQHFDRVEYDRKRSSTANNQHNGDLHDRRAKPSTRPATPVNSLIPSPPGTIIDLRRPEKGRRKRQAPQPPGTGAGRGLARCSTVVPSVTREPSTILIDLRLTRDPTCKKRSAPTPPSARSESTSFQSRSNGGATLTTQRDESTISRTTRRSTSADITSNMMAQSSSPLVKQNNIPVLSVKGEPVRNIQFHSRSNPLNGNTSTQSVVSPTDNRPMNDVKKITSTQVTLRISSKVDDKGSKINEPKKSENINGAIPNRKPTFENDRVLQTEPVAKQSNGNEQCSNVRNFRDTRRTSSQISSDRSSSTSDKTTSSAHSNADKQESLSIKEVSSIQSSETELVGSKEKNVEILPTNAPPPPPPPPPLPPPPPESAGIFALQRSSQASHKTPDLEHQGETRKASVVPQAGLDEAMKLEIVRMAEERSRRSEQFVDVERKQSIAVATELTNDLKNALSRRRMKLTEEASEISILTNTGHSKRYSIDPTRC